MAERSKIGRIEKAFNNHRKQARSCCDESCFCWNVEQILGGQDE